MIDVLIERTPYLAGGFVRNLLISAVSMGLGTGIGATLGWLRHHRFRATLRTEDMLTNLCRNVPSFVLLYYMAFMLPAEVEIAGRILAVPVWIKANLALTFPAIGFASDQALGYFRQRANGIAGAGETFTVAWNQYFLIIIMASATASVIGVDEIVGRANMVIARDDRPVFMLVTYLYVSLWFIGAGLLVSRGTLWAVRRRGPRLT
ncbi:hypothetical protein [Rhodovulum marinum]|uniref:ABC-type amino acid transport system permease subunit n=1 Tax=Rhodovulum marinum TaxID=320662 RepID=A0A4R2PXX7_9RHOB|nr:hypothetical protein [Rhodovulum marinum]TCP40174.1 ABC-type amino acid transport system permease subunit [Rhodovulum marinum]